MPPFSPFEFFCLFPSIVVGRMEQKRIKMEVRAPAEGVPILILNCNLIQVAPKKLQKSSKVFSILIPNQLVLNKSTEN